MAATETDIARYEPAIVARARRLSSNAFLREDLEQVGRLAVCEAFAESTRPCEPTDEYVHTRIEWVMGRYMEQERAEDHLSLEEPLAVDGEQDPAEIVAAHMALAEIMRDAELTEWEAQAIGAELGANEEPQGHRVALHYARAKLQRVRDGAG